jgi:hypothetical protein
MRTPHATLVTHGPKTAATKPVNLLRDCDAITRLDTRTKMANTCRIIARKIFDTVG